MALERKYILVAYEDGSSNRFVLSPRLVAQFEREQKTNIATGLNATGTFRLAWMAQRATGAVIPDFETWLESIVDVEVETEAVPFATGAAAPGGGSPPSPSPPG